MTAEIAWEYDTRVWRQRLQSESGAWRLVRRIKETRADDTSRRERSAQSLADGGGAGRVRFLAPTYTSEGAVYDLTVSEVLASWLWPQTRVDDADLLDVMRGLGEALGALHVERASESVTGIDSPHLRRLAAHLSAGTATYAGLVVLQQKPEVIAQLRSWLADLPREGVLCHGGFTLGSVFVDPTLTTVEVPTGDELMASTPELDLGWMLGELTEFEYLAGMRGSDGSSYAAAAHALTDAWRTATGTTIEPRRLQRVVALRYFLHLCDFAETTHSTDTGSLNAPFLTWLVERADTAPADTDPEEKAP